MKGISQKFVSVVIATVLAATTFVVQIGEYSLKAYAADGGVAPSQIYDVKEEIYFDDFDDGILTTRFEDLTNQTYYSVTESGGAMNFIHSAASGAGESKIDLTKMVSGTATALTEGTYVISFDMKRQANRSLVYSLRGSGNVLVFGKWLKDNGELVFPDGSTVKGYNTSTDFINFFIVFKYYSAQNGGVPQLEFYVDNELLYRGDRYGSRNCGLDTLQIQQTASGTYDSTISIDNLKVYEAEINAAAIDAAELTAESIVGEGYTTDDDCIVLTQNLNLPKTIGTNNSSVSWSSTDDTLVSSDGTVNRPANGYLLSDKVTLTAQITTGGKSVTKTFDFKVKRQEKSLPANIDGDYILYDDFSGNVISANYRDINTIDNLSTPVGYIKAENGALTVEKTVSGNPQYSFIYELQDNQAVITANSGEYVLEYDISKDNRADVQSWIFSDYGRNTYNRAVFGLNGLVSNTVGSSPYPETPVNTVRDDMFHVKYHINTNTNKWSLWIDDAAVFTEASPNRTSLYGFSLFINSVGKAVVDNIKFYKIQSGTLVPTAKSQSFKITKDGIACTALDSAGNYRLSASYNYMDDGFTAPSVVLALYNKENNSLESVKAISAADLLAGNSFYFTDTITVPSQYDDYIVKGFAFSDMSTLTPLSSSIILE